MWPFLERYVEERIFEKYCQVFRYQVVQDSSDHTFCYPPLDCLQCLSTKKEKKKNDNFLVLMMRFQNGGSNNMSQEFGFLNNSLPGN